MSASAMRWLHGDERGSIIPTTDNAGAATPYTYGPYGEPGGGSWAGSRYRYTGQIALPEAQLYHYKARVYDPNIGRFLQTDPIGYAGGMNLYAHVGNDPVNATDPLGTQDSDCAGAMYCRLPGFTISVPAPSSSWANVSFGAPPSSAFGFGGGSASVPATTTEEIVVTGNCDITCLQARQRIRSNEISNQLAADIWWNYLFPEFLGGPAGAVGGGVLSSVVRVCGCLEAGTQVATPEGLKPIEQIAVGDMVVAWNPDTRETSPQRVEALIRPAPKPTYQLKVRDADGETEAFDATDDHPWYVEGAGWVETRNLRAGQRIETADDRGLTILSLAATGRVEQTYNLTVAGPHTFLVGEDGAEVHNQTLCQRAAALAAQLLRNPLEIRGTGGRLFQYDQAGRAHFDKATRQLLATPHMRVGTPHWGPNGAVNYTWQYRAMTEADFRTVNSYLSRGP